MGPNLPLPLNGLYTVKDAVRCRKISLSVEEYEQASGFKVMRPNQQLPTYLPPPRQVYTMSSSTTLLETAVSPDM